jgi:hypothetical protein
MNAAEFKKLINKHFAPKIRALGWKGSGFNFYKIESNHVIRVFGLQGAWFGGSVCCETAIHFDFIPDLAHTEINLDKISYASCLFRKRLSPKGYGDYHWTFKDNEFDNISSVNQIWDAFSKHGLNFYLSYDNFPSPFDRLQVKDFQDKSFNHIEKYHIFNKIEFAWFLKELNLLINRIDIAKEFSQYGLNEAKKWAIEMSKHNKGKIDEKYIEIYEKKFKITSP